MLYKFFSRNKYLNKNKCSNILLLLCYPTQLNQLYTCIEYFQTKHWTYLENFKCPQTKIQIDWTTRLNTLCERLELTTCRYVHSYQWSPKVQYGLHKRTEGSSCKAILNCRVTGLNGMLTAKVHRQVRNRMSHQVQYSLNKKIVTLSLLPCCESPNIYIFLYFKLTFGLLVPICSICYTDVLKYLASGLLIGYI